MLRTEWAGYVSNNEAFGEMKTNQHFTSFQKKTVGILRKSNAERRLE